VKKFNLDWLSISHSASDELIMSSGEMGIPNRVRFSAYIFLRLQGFVGKEIRSPAAFLYLDNDFWNDGDGVLSQKYCSVQVEDITMEI
jgi:hypothetical protein